MHNLLLEKACFDIDGVLCVDPEDWQNDDGEKYIQFINNAPLKLVPSRKIGYIVTSRLEKYRKDTELWLSKNHIEYGDLYMMDLQTAEERRELGNHAKFKANYYKQIKSAIWFVESNDQQAQEIASLTGKAVYCVDTHQYYRENIVRQNKSVIMHRYITPLKGKVKALLKSGMGKFSHKANRKFFNKK